ncbi:flavin reductase family protein [Microlunatus ginsengisoli]|uniref:Flavin reductase like domain-containing protein n=1 Tax=Microlunatus ginsengisoli TaxID=363863 RepID=A0ABP7APY4_9ACTN
MTTAIGEQNAKTPTLDRLTPEEFKSVFRKHPAGVTVITLRDQDRMVGFTATSVISVSADPPLLAFSVAGQSSSWPPLSKAATIVVNFLTAAQANLSARFATSGIDRFARGGWSLLDTGEPFLQGSGNWVRGRIVQRTPVGSSFLVCVEALSSSVCDTEQATDQDALVYADRIYHKLSTRSAL